MKEEKNLIPIGDKSIAAKFEKEGLQPFIDEVQRQVSEFVVPDMNKKKGRNEVRSFSYQIAKWSKKIDDTGKKFTAEEKKKLKVYDTERKRLRDVLGKIKEEVREPLTVWEKAEEERIAAIKERVEDIRSHKNANEKAVWADADSSEWVAALTDALECLKNVIVDESFQEFQKEAEHLKQDILERLKSTLEAAEAKQKADRLEAQIQKDKEEREAREAKEEKKRQKVEEERLEEQRKRDDAHKAEFLRIKNERLKEKQEAEDRRLAGERKVQDAERREKEAKQALIDAEKKALREKEEAVATERRRKDDEEIKKVVEKKKREDDVKHRGTVNTMAMHCFMRTGYTKEESIEIVKSIALGKIKHVTINY